MAEDEKKNKFKDLYGNNMESGMWFGAWQDENEIFLTYGYVTISIFSEEFQEFASLVSLVSGKANPNTSKKDFEEIEKRLQSHKEFIEEIKRERKKSRDSQGTEEDRKESEKSDTIN